jgi:hypothetical protein
MLFLASIRCGVKVTESSTNKQHTLSSVMSFPEHYALIRSTGVTQGNPLKGTSSTPQARAAILK